MSRRARSSVAEQPTLNRLAGGSIPPVPSCLRDECNEEEHSYGEAILVAN